MTESGPVEESSDLENSIDFTKLEFLKNRLVRLVAQNMDSTENKLIKDVVDIVRAEVRVSSE